MLALALAIAFSAAGCSWEYIDSTGKAVFRSDEAQFSEGLAVSWRSAKDFSEGLAPVGNGYDQKAGKWSYIDRAGRVIFTFTDK